MPVPFPHLPPLIVGLVGGVAAGKSSVARLLAGDDGTVIDADRIVHELQREPEVLTAMESIVGAPVRAPDGSLDRARVAEAAFRDPTLLKKLEALLHPRVGEEIDRALADHRRRASETGHPWVVVLDVPLLLESGYDRLCDRIVFIECDASARKTRAQAERRWTAEEVERREGKQASLEEKRRRAHLVVVNSGTREELQQSAAAARQVLRELHKSLGGRTLG